MELLERIWEFIGLFFRGSRVGSNGRSRRCSARPMPGISSGCSRESKRSTTWSRNTRRCRTRSCGRRRAVFANGLAAGETLDDILIEAFAVCREAGRRFLGMRHYDVQMIGGMVLHSGDDRRNGDGRRQDAGRHVAGLSERLGGQGRPRRHGQRLSGPPRHGVDGAALHGTGPDRRRDPERHGGRASGRRPTPATSPTARTTNSVSTTCATTCARRPAATIAFPSGCSSHRARCTTRSSTKSTTF